MTTGQLETDLAVGLAQITDGDAACVSCGEDAKVTVWNGADPDPEPYCWEHGRVFLTMTVGLFDQFWAK